MSAKKNAYSSPVKPGFFISSVPLLFLVVALAVNVWVFGDDGLSGSNQIVLIFAAAVAALIAFRLGYSWQQLIDGIVKSITSAMPAILILLFIGSLAGTWLISGIIPAMIYYGLQILNPAIFLFAACLISAFVSVATGSSWSTVATIGIALLGIGKALGIEEGIIGGAIISGAYFGDKMSPLSDTTNLAPAVAGTDLFTHIRYMTLTTVPSILITLVLFLWLGFGYSGTTSGQDVSEVLGAIDKVFNIHAGLFVVPVVVLVMIVRKVAAIPALFTGTVLGAVFALIFQPDLLMQMGQDQQFAVSAYRAIVKALYGSVSITTDSEIVNALLTSKGMAGMLNTIWLILAAMMFGGIMEISGMLQRITETIIRAAHSTGSLIASTATTCIFFNITTSDQYLAILVPGRMFNEAYRKKGLAPENLSRTLEDSGTVTSVLVPWNTCGATQSVVLGVATMAYLPYCFFNLLSPLMTILVAYLGFRIKKLEPEEELA